MTDLEATRLCAEAMGIVVDGVAPHGSEAAVWMNGCGPFAVFKPLYDDAQALGLVRKLGLTVTPLGEAWLVQAPQPPSYVGALSVQVDKSLNRAIVLCVAGMPVRLTTKGTVSP